MKQPSHNRVKRSSDELLLLAVAMLRSEGLTQQEIGVQLKINQGEVSTMLTQAENRQMITKSPVLIEKNINPKDKRKVREQFFTQKGIGERATLVAGGNHKINIHVINGASEKFTNGAAGLVLELLCHSRKVGVMWGRTLSEVVACIAGYNHTSRLSKIRKLECIPLCGDPVHLMNQWEMDYSASKLAGELERIATGELRPELPCLSGVPAYVSPKLLASPEFTNFLYSLPGYRQIFLDNRDSHRHTQRLVDQVDTVITGVGIIADQPGTQPHDTAAFIRERLAQELELNSEYLKKIIFGDIGGVLLERPDLVDNDAETVKKLNKGWIGITLDDLRRIARDANSKNFPGVVLLARGREKAVIVAKIISLRIVNNLIVDEQLAKELDEILKPQH